jgi:hypothetical protein
VTKPSFEQLIDEALAQPFEGWDFSWIHARNVLDPWPWDYGERVREAISGIASLLDHGTGGGEFIVGLDQRPPLTVATEGWMPNVPVADANLRPIGAHLVAAEGAADNVAQPSEVVDGRLPFRSDTFALVIDRHDAFRASEVARVLKPGGTFITQQIGGRNEIELNETVGTGPPEACPTLDEYVAQLEAAGLDVIDAEEAFVAKRYLDVGAVAYFMKAIPWQVGGFDVTAEPERLRVVHEMIERDGSFAAHMHRFFFRAVKPG